MREIKFRVWTGIKMEYNIMAGWLGAFYVEGISETDSASMSYANTIYLKSVPVMQFTGLTDKNGKEIYERDIVKTQFNELGTVVWFYKGWAIDLQTSTVNAVLFEKCDVIGNIYENPELIKKLGEEEC